MNRAALAGLAFLLAGCLGAGPAEEDVLPMPPVQPTTRSAHAENASNGSLDDVRASDCFETVAEFPSDPESFDDGLPEGFELVLDASGRATVAAIARSCRLGDLRADLLLALVLVEPPEPLRLPDAAHGAMLSAWTDSEALQAAFEGWDLRTFQLRAIEVASSDSKAGAESRTRVEPDFLLAIQAAEGPSKVPYESLRVFEVVEREITAGLDSHHERLQGRPGAATAHFIIEPRVGDVPDHRAGAGWVQTSPPFWATYRALAV